MYNFIQQKMGVRFLTFSSKYFSRSLSTGTWVAVMGNMSKFEAQIAVPMDAVRLDREWLCK